jgi:hypothetical protein
MRQTIWAVLDTGSAMSFLSLAEAHIFSAGLSKPNMMQGTTSQSVAIGETNTKISFLALRRQIGVSVGEGPTQLSVTWPAAVGVSFLSTELGPDLSFEVGALLGLSEITPCRRVTFDYRGHRLLCDLAPPSVPSSSPTGTNPAPTR